MLKAGSTIGILGGGQLARMLAGAALRMGYHTHVYDPNPKSPALEISSLKTIGSFEDHGLLKKFAKTCDVLTYEFENIPHTALEEIEQIVQIFPRKTSLYISQDRGKEKQFFKSLNLETVEYATICSFEDFSKSIKQIKTPSILKTCREGYDGKGQLLITNKTKKKDVEEHLLQGPCILESFLKFEKELSVIIARNDNGDVVSFDPGENVHKSGILYSTTVPSQISKTLQIDSIIIAGKIVNSLKHVGVLGVELFLTHDDRVVVNEIAPRVHNSGHWTQNGCAIDQFEQHIRAISGHALGDGERYSDVTMINILGDTTKNFRNITNAAVHFYGKDEARPGRKMGHVNYVSPKTS